MSRFTKLMIVLTIAAFISMGLPWFCPEAIGKQPKSKFYDFNDQIIDGEIKIGQIMSCQCVRTT